MFAFFALQETYDGNFFVVERFVVVAVRFNERDVEICEEC